MNHQTLQMFFMWGTIVGSALVLLSTLGWIGGRRAAQRIHGRIFGISPQMVDLVGYSSIAALKMMVVIFFLIPWIAMLLARA